MNPTSAPPLLCECEDEWVEINIWVTLPGTTVHSLAVRQTPLLS